MTTNELGQHLNKVYDETKKWPETFKVDKETYMNVLLSIFEYNLKYSVSGQVIIFTGENDKLIYKNTLLYYKDENDIQLT